MTCGRVFILLSVFSPFSFYDSQSLLQTGKGIKKKRAQTHRRACFQICKWTCHLEKDPFTSSFFFLWFSIAHNLIWWQTSPPHPPRHGVRQKSVDLLWIRRLSGWRVLAGLRPFPEVQNLSLRVLLPSCSKWSIGQEVSLTTIWLINYPKIKKLK